MLLITFKLWKYRRNSFPLTPPQKLGSCNLSPGWKAPNKKQLLQTLTGQSHLKSLVSRMELPSQPQLVMKVLVAQSFDFFVIPWTAACQAPLFMEFSRPEYWSELPFPSPGDLPNPETESRFPVLQADSSPSEPPGVTCQMRLRTRCTDRGDLKEIEGKCLIVCILYSMSDSENII